MGTEFIQKHPFSVISIIGCVVFAVSVTLLISLLVKGWKTNTLRGYVLIYALLFNMVLIWGCQIPLNWLQPIDQPTSCDFDQTQTCYQYKLSLPKLLSVIKLEPISIFLFSLQYYKIAINLIGRNYELKLVFEVILWTSYLFIFILVTIEFTQLV